MTDNEQLLETYARKLKKALKHLDYSYNKILKLSDKVEILDDEDLETWESFAARFSRVVDIFLTRYLRAFILMNDPGFNGSLRDFVNQGEKLGIIDNADSWMSLRELRNISAHDYSERDLGEFFSRLKQECPKLLNIKLD
jgi:hypothetical protein